MSDFHSIIEHGYTPRPNGTQDGYPPCAVCAGTSFQLFDDGPSCLTCFARDADVDTYAEAATQALQALSDLSALELTPKTREQLRHDINCWRVILAITALRVTP